MEEHQKDLSEILGLGRGLTAKGSASWAEIYAEIGRLKERAEKPQEIIKYFPNNEPIPLGSYEPKFKCVCGNPMPHSYCVTCKSN